MTHLCQYLPFTFSSFPLSYTCIWFHLFCCACPYVDLKGLFTVVQKIVKANTSTVEKF